MRTAEPMNQGRKSTDRRMSRMSMGNFVFNDEVERQVGKRSGKYLAKKQGKEHFDGFACLSDLLSVSSMIRTSEPTSQVGYHPAELINGSNRQEDTFVLDQAVLKKHDPFAIQGLSSIKKRYSNSPPRVSGASLLLMLRSGNRSNDDPDVLPCQEDSKTEGFLYTDKSIPEEERVPWNKMGIINDAETKKERVVTKEETQGQKLKKKVNLLHPPKKETHQPVVQNQTNKSSQRNSIKPRKIEPQVIRKSNVMVMPNIIERDEVQSQCSKVSHKPKQNQADAKKVQPPQVDSKPNRNLNADRPILGGYAGKTSAPSTTASTNHISSHQPQGMEPDNYIDDRQPNKKRQRGYRKSASDSQKSVNMKQPRKQHKIETVKLQKGDQSKEKGKKKSRPTQQDVDDYYSLAGQPKKISQHNKHSQKKPSNKENKRDKINTIKQETCSENNFRQNSSRKNKSRKDRNNSKKSKNQNQRSVMPNNDCKSSRIVIPVEDIIASQPDNQKRIRIRPVKFWQEKLELKKGLIVGVSTTHPEMVDGLAAKYVSKTKQINEHSKEEQSEEKPKKHADGLSIETTFGIRSHHRLIQQMEANTYRVELQPTDTFRVEKGFFKALDIRVIAAKQGKVTISFTTISHKLIKSFFVSAYEDFKITNNSATKTAIIEFSIAQ